MSKKLNKKTIAGAGILLAGLYLLAKSGETKTKPRGTGALGGVDPEDLGMHGTTEVLLKYKEDRTIDTQTDITDSGIQDTDFFMTTTHQQEPSLTGTYVQSTTAGTPTYTQPITQYDPTRTFHQNILAHTYMADGTPYAEAKPITSSWIELGKPLGSTGTQTQQTPLAQPVWSPLITPTTTGTIPTIQQLQQTGMTNIQSTSQATTPTQTRTITQTTPVGTSRQPTTTAPTPLVIRTTTPARTIATNPFTGTRIGTGR